MTPDFLVDDKGQWYLIDANLNIGGEGLIEAIQARGLNYPEESLKAFFARPFSLETNAKFTASFAKPTFGPKTKTEISLADTFEELLRNQST